MEYTVNKFRNFEIREYEILDSTSEQAKRDLAADMVIVAKSQTAGKGRNGRHWVSEEGNLFFSVITQAGKISRPEITSYIAALAVSAVLENIGVANMIKWPNDILVGGRKICGILAEKHGNFIITGIGVNINSSPTHLERGRQACCLNDYNKKANTKKLMNEILAGFSLLLSEYTEKGFAVMKPRLLSRLYMLGHQIMLDNAGRKITGRLTGISDEGSLLIETATSIEEYNSGEISEI